MVPHVTLEAVELRLKRFGHPQHNLKDLVLEWFGQRRATAAENSFAALSEIDLSIASGERIGIVGRNGAGKSSLLRVISGIYPATSGKVEIHGFLVPLLQADVGFCSELTARENILQAGAILGIPARVMREKIDPILEFAELTDFAETPIKYFSKGMATRLSFTTATTAQADILILDEALGGGDLAFRERAQQRLEEMIARTKIVVMASHSMDTVKRLCSRVLWLDRGRVRADGAPEDVVAQYQQEVLQAANRRKCA